MDCPVDAIERIVTHRRLPTLPHVAVRVLELTQSQGVTMQELAEVVGADPALAGKLIRYCNSPVAGLSREVRSLPHAVVITGLKRLKTLALGFSLMTLERSDASHIFNYDRFWSESLARAVSGATLSLRSGRGDPDEAFLACLMAQIGRLVLAVSAPEEYERTLGLAAESHCLVAEAERSSLGFTSQELGAWVLRNWRFPDFIVQAVRCAGQPQVPNEPPGALPAVVELASIVARIVVDGGRDAVRWKGARDMAAARFQIPVGDWNDLLDEIGARWVEYGQVLAVDTGAWRSAAEIEFEARERLIQLQLHDAAASAVQPDVAGHVQAS